MEYKNDEFLKERISLLLRNEDVDMFQSIGIIRDLFSSAYLTNKIASDYVINDVWKALFEIFDKNKIYSNQFDAITTMYDIYIYAEKNNVLLNLEPLKIWRNDHSVDNISPEILECVDEILHE